VQVPNLAPTLKELLKQNIMNKDNYYKHLQNLNSWKSFALSGAFANVPVANQIDDEIYEFQEKWSKKLEN
jgi:hypothetical protein